QSRLVREMRLDGIDDMAASGDFDGNGTDDVLLRRTDGAWTYYPVEGSAVVDAGRGWANLTRSTEWRVARTWTRRRHLTNSGAGLAHCNVNDGALPVDYGEYPKGHVVKDWQPSEVPAPATVQRNGP
ncbi:MAG: hypothetical protein OXK79_04710, partial [Chloroflexota bacterium]|nr:hypothetical protein [Chloroflexota bacterium]